MNLSALSWRNVVRRRGRWTPPALNLVAFGLVFTVLSGAGDAFLRNLEARALVYYGGGATILTYQVDQGHLDETALAPDDVATVVEGLPWVKTVRSRHVYRQPGAQVAGLKGAVDLRLIIGVDDEPGLAGQFDLTEGREAPGPGGILLPRSAAVRLDANLGDSVLVALKTATGQRNTAPLKVTGVYQDDPVFGRGVAYVDRASLNRWTGRPPAYATEVNIESDGVVDEGRAQALTHALSPRWPVWNHPLSKKAFLAQWPQESWQGTKSVVLTLADHTADLTLALGALRGALDAVALLLLVVASLGLGGTLKVMLHERTKEIGTMRALGMTIEQVFFLIQGEAVAVAALATAVGVAVGYLVLGFLSTLTLTGLTLAEPLLLRGSLGYVFSLGPGLAALGWAVAGAFWAARGPLIRATHRPPAEALATGT